MKLPWLKWWPGDWLSDEALRGCSLEARGLWADMLSLMAKSDRHGFLLAGKTPMNASQLSRIAGISYEKCEELLAELGLNGVYSVEDGIIYSRRMVKEEKERESLRDRVYKHRNANVTEQKQECNAPVTPQRLEARGSDATLLQERKRFTPPTEAEWVQYAKEKYPDWEENNVKSAWAYYESIGWKTNTRSFTRWRGCVATCYHNWKQRSTTMPRKTEAKQPASSPKHTCESPPLYRIMGYSSYDEWSKAGFPS